MVNAKIRFCSAVTHFLTRPLRYAFDFLESMTRDEAQNKRAIAAIEESLIGFTGSLENKTFLHEGALIELDPDNYRPICRVYFFLLNDLLIVGKVKQDKTDK